MDIYFIANFLANVSNFLSNHLIGYQKEFRDLEILRKKFVSDFPISDISNLSLDQFTAGNYNRRSFCSRLENELKPLGDMHGSYIDKFGVYYSNKRDKYECAKKWDSKRNLDNGFVRLKIEISKLLVAGQNKDLRAIDNNRISPLFKGKILATYFPNEYFPIFSSSHIKYFMNIFQMEYDYNLTLEENKQKLLQIYEYDERLKRLNYHLLMKFMYAYDKDFLGQQAKLKSKSDIPIQVELNYHNLKEQHTTPSGTSHNANHALSELKKVLQGDRAESLVVRFEQNKLKNCGRIDLSHKVEQVSKTRGDGLGYDILSFNENGDEIYIEVKSKKYFNNTIDFYLTDTEFKFLDAHPNSFIYYVYDVYEDPKIHITTLSRLKTLGNNWKNPILYKIEIEASKS